jgi:hypothetical protein
MIGDRLAADERLFDWLSGNYRNGCKQIRREVADQPAFRSVVPYLARVGMSRWRFGDWRLDLSIEVALYPNPAFEARRWSFNCLAHQCSGRFWRVGGDMSGGLTRGVAGWFMCGWLRSCRTRGFWRSGGPNRLIRMRQVLTGFGIIMPAVYHNNMVVFVHFLPFWFENCTYILNPLVITRK